MNCRVSGLSRSLILAYSCSGLAGLPTMVLSCCSSVIRWMLAVSVVNAVTFAFGSGATPVERKVQAMSEQSGYSVEGGCLCGAVRFELTEPPVSAGYCHCTRCQRRTGTAASVSAQIDGDALRIISGSELISGWTPGDAGWEKCFCSSCGAHLYSRSPADPRQIGVRMSAFDSDPGVRPSFRQYLNYAASWEPIPDDGLERFPEARPRRQS